MPNMLQRCYLHDYRERCIYLITLTVAGRRPILGRLVSARSRAKTQRCEESANTRFNRTEQSTVTEQHTLEQPNPFRPIAARDRAAQTAVIRLSPLGEIVRDCWLRTPAFHPEISLMEFQVMPDHFHGIIFVRERMTKPLGSVIRAFKADCSSRAGESFWDKGFQDSILRHKDQLPNMRNYVLDNPRRLAIKRSNPDLFRIGSNIEFGGITFAAIGNRFLLDRPVKLQIQCLRRITDAELSAKTATLIDEARKGAVLVSPCISLGEKSIAHAALAEKLPLIVLLENGFPPLYKPPKSYFDACANGLLLMLAPWPYHANKHTITREQCLALNQMTAAICH